MAAIETDLPVGIDVHRVSNQPEVVDEVGRANSCARWSRRSPSCWPCRSSAWACAPASSSRCRVPLVLAITFVAMMLLGIDLQRISLGALIIALGLLVDDAIIAVEMMMVKLEQGCDRIGRRPTPTPRPPSRC